MGGRPWVVVAGGLTLAVRLTPKGGRAAIDSIQQSTGGRPVLRVRVSAAPVDGEANAALVRVLAKALGIAPRAVTLVAGQTARVKRLKIDGDGIALAAALERICTTG